MKKSILGLSVALLSSIGGEAVVAHGWDDEDFGRPRHHRAWWDGGYRVYGPPRVIYHDPYWRYYGPPRYYRPAYDYRTYAPPAYARPYGRGHVSYGFSVRVD